MFSYLRSHYSVTSSNSPNVDPSSLTNQDGSSISKGTAFSEISGVLTTRKIASDLEGMKTLFQEFDESFRDYWVWPRVNLAFQANTLSIETSDKIRLIWLWSKGTHHYVKRASRNGKYPTASVSVVNELVKSRFFVRRQELVRSEPIHRIELIKKEKEIGKGEDKKYKPIMFLLKGYSRSTEGNKERVYTFDGCF